MSEIIVFEVQDDYFNTHSGYGESLQEALECAFMNVKTQYLDVPDGMVYMPHPRTKDDRFVTDAFVIMPLDKVVLSPFADVGTDDKGYIKDLLQEEIIEPLKFLSYGLVNHIFSATFIKDDGDPVYVDGYKWRMVEKLGEPWLARSEERNYTFIILLDGDNQPVGAISLTNPHVS